MYQIISRTNRSAMSLSFQFIYLSSLVLTSMALPSISIQCWREVVWMSFLISFLLAFSSQSETTINPKAMPLSFHLPLNKNIQIKVLRWSHESKKKKSHVATLGPGESDVTFASRNDKPWQSRPTLTHLPVSLGVGTPNLNSKIQPGPVEATIISLCSNSRDGHIKHRTIYHFSFWNWRGGGGVRGRGDILKRNKQLFLLLF